MPQKFLCTKNAVNITTFSIGQNSKLVWWQTRLTRKKLRKQEHHGLERMCMLWSNIYE